MRRQESRRDRVGELDGVGKDKHLWVRRPDGLPVAGGEDDEDRDPRPEVQCPTGKLKVTDENKDS